MLDWVTSVSTEVDANVPTLAMRLVAAWVCGWIIAVIARRNRLAGTADTLSLTLILMSILIAMATQIIGDNIARAFSLVGALSIVRFRTAVPETRDVAFVLAAVVVGMAVGAGQYWVAAIGLFTVGMAVQINTTPSPFDESVSSSSKMWRLTLIVGLHTVGGWESELERMTESYELLSAETVRRGGAIELAYRYKPHDDFDASTLVAALNAIPTVESASAKVVA